jgi:hypothetical protein
MLQIFYISLQFCLPRAVFTDDRFLTLYHDTLFVYSNDPYFDIKQQWAANIVAAG